MAMRSSLRSLSIILATASVVFSMFDGHRRRLVDQGDDVDRWTAEGRGQAARHPELHEVGVVAGVECLGDAELGPHAEQVAAVGAGDGQVVLAERQAFDARSSHHRG